MVLSGKFVRRASGALAFGIDAARLCFDRRARSAGLADLVPPLQGALPTASSKPVLFAAADPIYLERFGERFVVSAMSSSPDLSVHLHCYDAGDSDWQVVRDLQARWPQRIGLSWESMPQLFQVDGTDRAVYCQAMRFVRIAEIVRAGRPVLALDLDCLIRRDLGREIAAAGAADIGLFLRRAQLDPAKRVLAACFYAASSGPAQRYLDTVAGIVARHLFLARPCAKLDQLALYWAYVRRRRDLAVWSLPLGLADWTMQPGSAVWNAKGARKSDPLFLAQRHDVSAE